MRKYAVGYTMIVLAGCAALPPPPLHAAWYLQYTSCNSPGIEEVEQCKPGVTGSSVNDRGGFFKLYVALLNRSGREIVAKDVIVNRSVDGAGGTWHWLPKGAQSVPRLVLRNGVLVAFPASELKDEQGKPIEELCFLPVDIAIALADDTRLWYERWYGRAQGDSSGVIRAELAGRMPSSLPDDWAIGCQPTSGR